jgi:hypothetical protein
MVRASVQVLADPGLETSPCPGGGEVVDQAVAAWGGQVGVGVSEAAPVVGVVDEVEVRDVDLWPPDGPRLLRVLGEDDVLGRRNAAG